MPKQLAFPDLRKLHLLLWRRCVYGFSLWEIGNRTSDLGLVWGGFGSHTRTRQAQEGLGFRVYGVQGLGGSGLWDVAKGSPLLHKSADTSRRQSASHLNAATNKTKPELGTRHDLLT